MNESIMKNQKMKSLTSKLIALLAIQVVLVAAFFINNQQDTTYAQESLFSLSQTDFDKVEKIVIKEDDNAVTLTLNNQTKKWELSERNNLPVATFKISSVIDKLKSLKTSWPIATTEASHERFEVSKDKFQRYIMFYQGDKLVSELYLGTSPGFRKIHARLAGKDEVYSLKLNNFDFSGDANDWLDKSLLASNSPSKIKGGDFELVKSEEKWSLAKPIDNVLTTDSSIDEEKAKQLVAAIESLTVQKEAKQSPQTAPVSIEVSLASGSVKYDFFKDNDNYFVRRNDINSVFNISQTDYEKITQFNLTSLMAEKTEAVENMGEEAPLEEHAVEEKTTSANSDNS